MDTFSVLIVGNGDIPERLDRFVRDVTIAADRAALILLGRGIVPDIAVGDFDSVTAGELDEIRNRIPDVREFPPRKDETDLELAAAAALELKPRQVTVTGATGGRMDHLLANIGLLERLAAAGTEAVIVDAQNEIRLLTRAGCTIPADPAYPYFSILPVTETAVVTLTGCAYPVDTRPFRRGGTLGVSNAVAGTASRIVVHDGTVLLVRSGDRTR
jgi:thiamine pyrophosphokinase